jgi:hypothetical protein
MSEESGFVEPRVVTEPLISQEPINERKKWLFA